MDIKTIFKSKKILAIAAIIILIPIIVFSCSHHKKKVLLDKIIDSHYDNAAVCKEKYDGKEVTFICKVSSVDSSLDHFSVKSDYELVVISCNLTNEKQKEQAKKMKRGDEIEIKGTLHLSDELGFMIEVDVEKISR